VTTRPPDVCVVLHLPPADFALLNALVESTGDTREQVVGDALRLSYVADAGGIRECHPPPENDSEGIVARLSER
jgi:hypothetical protein